jgi:hypothetical protein
MVGGRQSKIIACIALALALSACFASWASAEGEEDTGGFGAFRLKGTNGFSILVLAFSKPHFKHGEAIVWATNKRNASVFYLAPATVTAATIDADLGAVGEISLAFEPSGPPETVHASCKRGGSVSFEPGAWVGDIDLTGEEGFTRVQRSRSKAIATPFVEARCGVVGIGEISGSQVRGARLVARSAGKKQAIYLQANQNHPGAPVYVETSIEERRGGLIVSRGVADHFSSGAFDFASPLRTATLAPPAPFDGQATFRRNADPANRWTGNLSVDFPGRADVSLAGKRFKAALVHAKRTEEVTLYDRLARPSLLPW